ncbi:hypothetical protein GGF39_003118 [Coemansia sp. RSA 1721]|nr:hypothetical protein GGF39_003118 [Coemansia sp. RSA 1721]
MTRATDVSINTPMKLGLGMRITLGIVTGFYMATGIAAMAVSGYFLQTKGTSRQTIIVTDNVLRSLMAAGVYLVLNNIVGIVAILSPLKRKRWIVAYIWLVVIAMLVETGVGIWMWVRTLDINDLYGHNWRSLWSDDIKGIFQDSGSCCGYLGPTDSPVAGFGSCGSIDAYGCMVAVQTYARDYLAYIYTCLFSFVFIDVCALLSGMVLLVMRNDEERWRWSRANAILKSYQKIESKSMLNSDMQEFHFASGSISLGEK